MAKLFGWVLGVVLVLGSCGLLLDDEVSSDPGLVQETAGSGINASGSNET